MKKVFHYLKPFTLWVIVSLGVLFGQAMCDLALPNYMSDIVNVGLQQGGVTESAPKALSVRGMALMNCFMTEEEQAAVSGAYRLAPAGTVSDYPLNAAEDVYVRESGESAAAAAFSRASLTFLNWAKEQSPGENGGASDSIDLNALYGMIPYLQTLPPEAFDDARAAADAVGADMQTQTATALNRMFYQELGLDTAKIQSDYIWRTGFIMLGITLAGVVASVLVGLFSSRIAAGVARNMRRDVFRKVEEFASREFDEFSTASLITRTTNDITQIQMLITMGLRIMCYAPIMGVGGIIMAVMKSVSMSWIVALSILVPILVVICTFIAVFPKFKRIQKLTDRLNLVSRENLSGLMVVRAFGTEDFETRRFDKANTDLTKNNLFINRVMSALMPFMTIVMNGVMLLIIWVGAHQIAASAMQVGDMMAYMQYVMHIVLSFSIISMMFIMVPRAAVSASRVSEVLNKQPSVVDPDRPKEFDPAKRGVVEFDRVCFRYAGATEDVLHDITFTARPGETTAFIGSTGSGKSTLVNLIPRFYDVTAGAVRVSGADVREVAQHALREEIGYVPQRGMLLTGSIADNLRYGKKGATDAEIASAAETAQAAEIIAEKEEGYAFPIAQGGSNVSGGQKQRLSIARALVKDAPVYVFDDSFSALDFKTDARLRAALKKKTENSAVLVVAQRVSSIMNAEQIIVLDEGRIAGKGTHKELLENCPVYREIALSQLSGEEL